MFSLESEIRHYNFTTLLTEVHEHYKWTAMLICIWHFCYFLTVNVFLAPFGRFLYMCFLGGFMTLLSVLRWIRFSYQCTFFRLRTYFWHLRFNGFVHNYKWVQSPFLLDPYPLFTLLFHTDDNNSDITTTDITVTNIFLSLKISWA